MYKDHLSDVYWVERVFRSRRKKWLRVFGALFVALFLYLFGDALLFGPPQVGLWVPVVGIFLFVGWCKIYLID